MGQVYQAKNLLNGKVYIGKTIYTFEKRLRNHVYYSKTEKGGPFHRAIAKHGIENFEWSVLFESNDEKELFDKETYLIKELKTNDSDFGYNITKGGEGVAGRIIPKEENERRSRAVTAYLTGKPKSEETKRKISETKKGRKITNTVFIKKMSKRNSGANNPMSLESIAKRNNCSLEEAKKLLPGLGRRKSEEERLKISLANKGKRRAKKTHELINHIKDNI